MKRVRDVAGLAIGLVFAVSIFVAFLLPSPVDVAGDYCSASLGVPVQDLALLNYHRSRRTFAAGRARVDFLLKGSDPAKNVVVELHRPAYFLPWQVKEFREEAQQ